MLIKREQYYIDQVKSKYNILKIAGNVSDFKQSKATKIQMSINNTGINNPLFDTKHSYETNKKKKISESLRLNTIPKVMTTETRLLISKRCQGISVKVFDKTNNFVNQFPTVTSAALYFNVDPKKISITYKTGKSYDKFVYKF